MTRGKHVDCTPASFRCITTDHQLVNSALADHPHVLRDDTHLGHFGFGGEQSHGNCTVLNWAVLSIKMRLCAQLVCYV